MPHERTGFETVFAGWKVRNPMWNTTLRGTKGALFTSRWLRVGVKVHSRGNIEDHCGLRTRVDHFLKTAESSGTRKA